MKKWIIWIISASIIVTAYFLGSHFEFTQEKRFAKHRIGIENLNELEKQIVGRWWLSYDGGRTDFKYQKYRYFILSADRRHWKKSESGERPNYADWKINPIDSILTFRYDKNKNDSVRYKLTYADSTKVYLERLKKNGDAVHVEWKKFDIIK
ncbi:hypothetical protein [Bernardetia sp.]|uniref:hypothetical protein n=1 Tax=Bernardetia sp. TaxID=1937974 RepID=UPI0025BA8A3A|nr:hypothetical protein [Bernardetia sp.]